jgi:hypothetical protein
MAEYWRTTDEDKEVRTHLAASGDHTICGHDLCGDPEVHSKEPERLPGKSRITCQHCLALIETVREHLRGGA